MESSDASAVCITLLVEKHDESAAACNFNESFLFDFYIKNCNSQLDRPTTDASNQMIRANSATRARKRENVRCGEGQKHTFFAPLIFEKETGKFAHFPILLLGKCLSLTHTQDLPTLLWLSFSLSPSVLSLNIYQLTADEWKKKTFIYFFFALINIPISLCSYKNGSTERPCTANLLWSCVLFATSNGIFV